MRSDVASKPPGKRVLFVEDEALVQMLGVEFLEEMGWQVETASSAAEAMDKAKPDGRIDLAIVDVGLPDRKGDDLVAELRSLYPRLPILIASGYDGEQLRNRFGGDPCLAIVGKPYSAERLNEAISAVWTRR